MRTNKIRFVSIALVFYLGLVCQQIKSKQVMENNEISGYTETDILKDLDNAEQENPYKSFLHFENGLFYPIANKILLYGDEERWAIVFEEAVYANNAPNLKVRLIYFGNCLINLRAIAAFTTNTHYVDLLSDVYLSPLTTNSNLISKNVDVVSLKGEKIKIERNPQVYLDKKIPLYNSKQDIDWIAFARYLADVRTDLLDARDEEIRTHLPADLPKLMTIDKWHYKDYGKLFMAPAYGTPPSSYETFQQIAQVLVTKDTSKYHPTLKPNNHWSNWPNAGQR